MTTTNDMSNPDGGDRARDVSDADVAILERNLKVLRWIVEDCEGWAWVSIRYLLDCHGAEIGEPELRDAIKALRIKGVIEIVRGGVNEDGEVCGGSGYGPTEDGRRLAKI